MSTSAKAAYDEAQQHADPEGRLVTLLMLAMIEHLKKTAPNQETE